MKLWNHRGGTDALVDEAGAGGVDLAIVALLLWDAEVVEGTRGDRLRLLVRIDATQPPDAALTRAGVSVLEEEE